LQTTLAKHKYCAAIKNVPSISDVFRAPKMFCTCHVLLIFTTIDHCAVE